MCSLIQERSSGIQFRKQINELKKEIFRKGIHLCTLFVPFCLRYNYLLTLAALSAVLAGYVFAELLRIQGKPVPLVANITATAARKRDESGFVLGPVTLACGVLLTSVFFNAAAAAVGICALALGDGIASLVGKTCGRIIIPHTNGKSAEGSLSCFLAVFLSTSFLTGDALISVILALTAMYIEMLPLKDLDNLFIPLALAAFAEYFFGL